MSYDVLINWENNKAYRARESVFLNFDIIDLTFKSDTKGFTVIPVSSDPTNHIPDVTPPIHVGDSTWEAFLKMLAELKDSMLKWLKSSV